MHQFKRVILKDRRALLAGYLMFLVLPFAAPGKANGQTYDDPQFSLSWGGLTRTFLVHTPPNYDGVTPLPLMLGFHGQGPGATSFRLQSGFNAVADQYGFIMVYPNGTGPKYQLSWNSGPGAKNYASANNIDDVGFARSLIAWMTTHYAINTNRIYSTGMSNGASMTHRLGIELSGEITAIGTVSGLLAITESPPPRPVPEIHFHGEADPLVPYSWVAYTINWWKRADHCQFSPISVDVESDRTVYVYGPAPKKTGAPVVLYALPNGGHTWPGGVDVTAGMGTGNLITTVPASQLIWQFVSQFTLNEFSATTTTTTTTTKTKTKTGVTPHRNVRHRTRARA